MPTEKAILKHPMMCVLHNFSSAPLKLAPTDSWNAIAIGTVSDMPIVRGEESRDEGYEIGVILKSLVNELMLSVRGIVILLPTPPLTVLEDAKDFDKGLYTLKELLLPAKVLVVDKLFDNKLGCTGNEVN